MSEPVEAVPCATVINVIGSLTVRCGHVEARHLPDGGAHPCLDCVACRGFTPMDPATRCTFHPKGQKGQCGKVAEDESVHWQTGRMRPGTHVWRHDASDWSGLERQQALLPEPVAAEARLSDRLIGHGWERDADGRLQPTHGYQGRRRCTYDPGIRGIGPCGMAESRHPVDVLGEAVEPRTEAGRALLAFELSVDGVDLMELRHRILAIEAEAAVLSRPAAEGPLSEDNVPKAQVAAAFDALHRKLVRGPGADSEDAYIGYAILDAKSAALYGGAALGVTAPVTAPPDSLDAAWREAEVAILWPESSLKVTRTPDGELVATAWTKDLKGRRRSNAESSSRTVYATGPTPASALRALAAKLRERSDG